jgi:YegS/Rv2252/BmrU family lipid kinase
VTVDLSNHMVAIIINPVSGGAAAADAGRRAERAASALRAAGEHGEVFVTERRGHARQQALAAIARGARLVIAWGGDGTVNEVASAVIESNATLGIVPSGSGNGLARELGIRPRPEQAVADALGARPRTIDVGELGGRIFVNVGGIGFDAHVAACFDRDVTARRGFSTYVRITVRELWGYRPATYRIDNAPSGRPALLIAFANSAQFGNGARIAPAARLDDGLLDLVVFEEMSRLATFCALPRLFNGTVGRLRGVSSQQIERASVEADGPIPFHVDGEPVQGGSRLEVRVRPGALRICVR